MAPCVGIPNVCPPLCQWYELEDGTYTMVDVLRFIITMQEIVEMRQRENGS